jgi:hypothetical protein
MNRLESPRITWVEGFGSSGWNFVVSLAEVMGLVAGCAELRGEVAYRVSGPATAANKYEVPPHGETRLRAAPGALSASW